MDFWDVIKNRHCARSFDKDRQVSDELVNKIITAAKMAPSAGNMQDWRFKVVRAENLKQQLVQAALNQAFITQCN
jgi:nitroreductase